MAPNDSNLDRDIQPLFLDAEEQAALVSFLKTFTDDRVRFERAPFDHPQLLISDVGDPTEMPMSAEGPGPHTIEIPAVGRGGNATPIKPYLAN
jgi:hypothetical protein